MGTDPRTVELVKRIDQTVLGPKTTNKNKNAKSCFLAQMLDLHLIMTVGNARFRMQNTLSSRVMW